MTVINLLPANQAGTSITATSLHYRSEAQYFSCIEKSSRPVCQFGIFVKPKVMVALDVMLVQSGLQASSSLWSLTLPTPGLLVVGLLSIVEHPGPASVVQDVPRYLTISCPAQVSVQLNINTCNGNDVMRSQIFILLRQDFILVVFYLHHLHHLQLHGIA